MPCFQFCDTGQCDREDNCDFAHVPGAKYLGNLISTKSWENAEGDSDFERMTNFVKRARSLLTEEINKENARLPERENFEKRINRFIYTNRRPTCRDFMNGSCSYKNCKFLHPIPDSDGNEGPSESGNIDRQKQRILSDKLEQIRDRKEEVRVGKSFERNQSREEEAEIDESDIEESDSKTERLTGSKRGRSMTPENRRTAKRTQVPTPVPTQRK